MAKFWPKSSGSGRINSQIRPDPAGSRPFWLEIGKFRPEFGHPVAGFRRRHNSGNLIPAPA
jgi:hypothetical protein